jgi:hypothetical protein
MFSILEPCGGVKYTLNVVRTRIRTQNLRAPHPCQQHCTGPPDISLPGSADAPPLNRIATSCSRYGPR